MAITLDASTGLTPGVSVSSLSGTLATGGSSTSVYIAIISSYFSAGGQIVNSITQSGVTWSQLGASMSFYTNGAGAMEAWIGYATTTPGTSFSCTMNKSVTSLNVCVHRFTGIPNQAVPLENYYSAYSAPSTSSVSESGIVSNGPDVEILANYGNYTGSPSFNSTINGAGLARTVSGTASSIRLVTAVQINSGEVSSHTDNFSSTTNSSLGIGELVVLIKGTASSSYTQNFSETITVSDTIQKADARAFATETTLKTTITESIINHRMPGGPRSYSDTAINTTIADTIVKNPGKLPKETFTLAETFSMVRAPSGPQLFAEAYTLAETFAKNVKLHPAFADALSLLDAFTPAHAQTLSFSEVVSLAEGFSPVHLHSIVSLEVLALTDALTAVYGQSLTFADLITVVETFAQVFSETRPFSDSITLADFFTFVHNATGGVLPVLATGALTGAGTAAAVVAAWLYASARGAGRATGLAGVAFVAEVMARGISLLHGLAGFEYTDSGVSLGGSAASGTEGACLVVASGASGGGGRTESDISLWTAPTGEADGASPEMDCDTRCIFSAVGTTMPDTPGSAVGVASYALLHLIARLLGASLAVGRVHSPVAASGGCEGDSTAEYMSIALYDSETVGGESEAVGVAGGLFHALGECDPIMSSNASGTANYGPGQIAAHVWGRGVAAGVPTLLAV